MNQAEELLNSLPDGDVSSYLIGDEPHIIVNSDRTIVVPDELKFIAVQFDNNVETVTFDCPRYWDGHDFSKMHAYINYMRPDGYKDQYFVKNLRVDDSDDSIIHFEWTISKNVTLVKGNISFLVCIKTAEDEEPHWNSRLNRELIVEEGLECFEQVVEFNPDIIEYVLARMEELENGNSKAWYYPDWSHLKWYAMGDSLTDRSSPYTEKYYYDFIHEKTGIQIIVDGVSATGYKNGEDEGKSFLDRVENIPADVDVVTIFGSGNDMTATDLEYANRAIYDTLAWLVLNRPGVRVVVVPPAPWKSPENGTNYDKRGDMWKAYCDRLQVCALACECRYLSDMYDCPPFNGKYQSHMEKFFTTDPAGIHPNEEGHKALAPFFYNALMQELALKV